MLGSFLYKAILRICSARQLKVLISQRMTKLCSVKLWKRSNCLMHALFCQCELFSMFLLELRLRASECRFESRSVHTYWVIFYSVALRLIYTMSVQQFFSVRYLPIELFSRPVMTRPLQITMTIFKVFLINRSLAWDWIRTIRLSPDKMMNKPSWPICFPDQVFSIARSS